MLLQISFCSVLLLFIGCGNNDSVPLMNSAMIFEKINLINPVEKIAISAKVDTVIRLKKGTIIAIEENSFEDADGNLITGEVEIEVKEVISASDMLSENMSTVTKDGVLETAGMLKIEATAEGKEVQLVNGKGLEIAFLKSGAAKKDMQLYYGVENENGILEWELGYIPSKGDLITKEDSIRSKSPSKQRKIFKRTAYYTINGKKGTFPLSNFPDIDNLLIFSDEEKRELDIYKYVDITKEDEENTILLIDYLLHDDGDFNVLRIRGRISKGRKKEIKKQLNNIPFINPSQQEGKAIDITGTIYLFFVEMVFDLMKPEDYSNYYLLTTSKLGWINCDFFLEFTEPKINMAVTVPNKDTALKLVFLNYNTMMTGVFENGKYVFANIPKGEAVKIIAISKEEDKAGFSLTETVVQKEFKELKPLEILSQEELKKKIELL